jgi:hypothetical protein
VVLEVEDQKTHQHGAVKFNHGDSAWAFDALELEVQTLEAIRKMTPEGTAYVIPSHPLVMYSDFPPNSTFTFPLLTFVDRERRFVVFPLRGRDLHKSLYVDGETLSPREAYVRIQQIALCPM